MEGVPGSVEAVPGFYLLACLSTCLLCPPTYNTHTPTSIPQGSRGPTLLVEQDVCLIVFILLALAQSDTTLRECGETELEGGGRLNVHSSAVLRRCCWWAGRDGWWLF